MSAAEAGRVLIADDDPNLVEVYLLFFEACDFIIRTASDRMGALAAYCAWRPDVVMLDIQMPRMDGWAVAGERRRMSVSPAPLLLAVTGVHAPFERVASLNAGFDHHFVKPAQLPVILTAIASRPTI
jgi:CheY-like chemotaxis protein